MSRACGAFGRRCLAAVVAALAVLALAAPARGADSAPWPSRPIRIVVPYSAGGTSDALARMLGEHLERELGQPVVVENRPGASGNIASEIVARAPADGYTLLVAGASMTILPVTRGAQAVDPVTAFAPVAKLATQPILVVANPRLPATTLAQLVALAQSEPGRIAYASAGVGTTDHLAAALLWSRARVDLLHIPYANNGAEVKDLLKGEVSLAFITLGAVRTLLQAGQLKALAVTTPHRAVALPDVPTVAESGFPGYDVTSWYGVVAPAGTPDAVVRRLHREIRRALMDPAIRDKMIALGTEPVDGSPEQFGDEIRAQVRQWASVAEVAGIGAR